MVPDSRFSASWCASVGHKMHHSSEWCVNCGLSALDIYKEQGACPHLRQVTPEGEYTMFRCLDCGVEGKVAHHG